MLASDRGTCGPFAGQILHRIGSCSSKVRRFISSQCASYSRSFEDHLRVQGILYTVHARKSINAGHAKMIQADNCLPIAPATNLSISRCLRCRLCCKRQVLAGAENPPNMATEEQKRHLRARHNSENSAYTMKPQEFAADIFNAV